MKRYLVLSALGLGLAVPLGGCASSGVNVTAEQVSSLEKGKTTYQEVVAKLGPPTTISQSSDGTMMAAYTYSAYETSPATFIPYVGMFAGGGTARARTVLMRFDSSGVLADYTASDSQYNSHLGTTSAGSSQPATVHQADN